MERHKTQTITCYGTMMGRFPRLTPVRPDSQSPGAGTHNRHTISKQTKTPQYHSILYWESHNRNHRDRRKPKHTTRIPKTCKDILRTRITTTSQTHHLGSHHRTTPRGPRHTPRATFTADSGRDRGSTKVRGRTP